MATNTALLSDAVDLLVCLGLHAAPADTSTAHVTAGSVSQPGPLSSVLLVALGVAAARHCKTAENGA